jgi:hypothetical protein
LTDRVQTLLPARPLAGRHSLTPLERSIEVVIADQTTTSACVALYAGERATAADNILLGSLVIAVDRSSRGRPLAILLEVDVRPPVSPDFSRRLVLTLRCVPSLSPSSSMACCC